MSVKSTLSRWGERVVVGAVVVVLVAFALGLGLAGFALKVWLAKMIWGNV